MKILDMKGIESSLKAAPRPELSHVREVLAKARELKGLNDADVMTLLGVEKPDPRIYRHALAQLSVPPDQVAFIGDSPALDVAPALAVGP